jgi:hypothetical protein
MAQRPVTLADIISGHVSLEIEGFSEEISDDSLLWRQYILMVDLYRSYIDLV